MKIFRAVERGMEIPGKTWMNWYFLRDVKELETKLKIRKRKFLSHTQQKPLFQPMSFPGRKKLWVLEAEPRTKIESVSMELEPAEEGVWGAEKEDSSVPQIRSSRSLEHTSD